MPYTGRSPSLGVTITPHVYRRRTCGMYIRRSLQPVFLLKVGCIQEKVHPTRIQEKDMSDQYREKPPHGFLFNPACIKEKQVRHS